MLMDFRYSPLQELSPANRKHSLNQNLQDLRINRMRFRPV